MPLILLVALLTFLHYVGAQMRGPVLPLYAVAHGASATGVGLIVGTHMAVAAVASIPLGRASDVWGRRRLMLIGMLVSAVTSLLLPAVEGGVALAAVYGLAGLGVAAFTPSALSLVGDAAPSGRAGQAYAWYSTAHYGAIGIGPFLGGLVAERYGYRTAFVVSGIGIAVALLAARALPLTISAAAAVRPTARFADIRRNASVWAGWVVALSGLLTQGVVFTFLPLLGQERGLTPSAIGFAFLVLGLANTASRFPAGWLVDRTGRAPLHAVAGVVVGSLATALLPHVHDRVTALGLIAVFGAAAGIVGVATGVALAGSTTPTTRGLVMGGYSTSLYLGLALGSFALGPVIATAGYEVGFGAAGAAGCAGAIAAAVLWASLRCTSSGADARHRLPSMMEPLPLRTAGGGAAAPASPTQQT